MSNPLVFEVTLVLIYGTWNVALVGNAVGLIHIDTVLILPLGIAEVVIKLELVLLEITPRSYAPPPYTATPVSVP
jgi:hypothetical protein